MNEDDDNSGQRRRVQEVLLAYLLAAEIAQWPGVEDGMTVDELLLGYPQAAREGLVPDLPALRQRHPELADVLSDFFAL